MAREYRLAMMVMLTMLVVAIAIPVAHATPISDNHRYEINLQQDGDCVTLSLAPQPRGAVYWDLDDGNFRSGASITYTYDESGLYNIRAVILTNGAAAFADRYIGVYSATAPSYVDQNAEYRYAVYNGPDAKLTVKDSAGRLVSWLTYDIGNRIVTGVPRTVGTYYVTLTGHETISWSITVLDGPPQTPWIRYSAHAEDGKIVLDSMHTSITDPAIRYTWMLSDIDGSLVSTSEGRIPNLHANPGVYGLELRAQGKNSSATYTQFIVLDGEPLPVEEPDSSVSPLLTIFVLAAVIMTLFFISTRDPRALFGVALTGIAIGILVIL